MDTAFLKSTNLTEADLRILLWDIDGTLLSSTVAGAYKEYFGPALKKVYGSAGKLAGLSVSGMTDTQIAYESLRDEGFTPDQILAEKNKLLAVLKKEMSDFVRRKKNPYRIFPGAREVLQKTSAHPRFINALLTGNLSVAAEIKLNFVGLWDYFKDVPHSFGEISHDRRQLAFAAGRIYRKFLKTELPPKQFIIIGDTPNDIKCARAFGARAVAVATGRNHTSDQLAAHGPDLVLESLEPTAEVFRNLIKL